MHIKQSQKNTNQAKPPLTPPRHPEDKYDQEIYNTIKLAKKALEKILKESK